MNNIDSFKALVVQHIINTQQKLKNGILPIKVIADSINVNRSEKKKISLQKVGKTVNALKFEHSNTTSGCAAMVWEDNKIKELADRYGLEFTENMGSIEKSSEKKPFSFEGYADTLLGADEKP